MFKKRVFVLARRFSRFRAIFFLHPRKRRITECLIDLRVVRIFRYVDDFLVFVDDHPEISFGDLVMKIVNLFAALTDGPKFTWEPPSDKCNQFLDLQLAFCESHPCWSYKPRTKKKYVFLLTVLIQS